MNKAATTFRIVLITLFTLTFFTFSYSSFDKIPNVIVPYNVDIPAWMLCVYLDPRPSFCDGLNKVKDNPVQKVATIESATNLLIEEEANDEFREMLHVMLCSIINPTPEWCSEIFQNNNKSKNANEDEDLCEGIGTDVTVPFWVLCHLFTPTPVFCKEYEKNKGTKTYTSSTSSYSTSPIYPPNGRLVESDGEDQYEIPWWILCVIIYPVPVWCPDVFKCGKNQLDHMDYPWWLMCTIMNPPPDECKYITLPPDNSQVAEWWVCVIIQPKPDWCKSVTYPNTVYSMITSSVSNKGSSTTQHISNGNICGNNATLKMDKEYPIWWMCIVLNSPPYWCKHATFPPDLDSPEIVKEIETGKRPYNFFLYCWWWLCEVFKPWAPWCKNLPPPPTELLESFPDSIPSQMFGELPFKDILNILP